MDCCWLISQLWFITKLKNKFLPLSSQNYFQTFQNTLKVHVRLSRDFYFLACMSQRLMRQWPSISPILTFHILTYSKKLLSRFAWKQVSTVCVCWGAIYFPIFFSYCCIHLSKSWHETGTQHPLPSLCFSSSRMFNWAIVIARHVCSAVRQVKTTERNITKLHRKPVPSFIGQFCLFRPGRVR